MLKTTGRLPISVVKLDKLRISKTMCSISEKCDGNILKNIFLKSVQAVQPYELFRTEIRYKQHHLEIKDQSFKLNKPCYVVGFGKAVLGMAIEMERILGRDVQRALVSVPKGIFKYSKVDIGKESRIEFCEGAENNLPDDNAVEGAKRIWDLIENLNQDDLLIVLISGGGSALFPLPIPPITLAEKKTLISRLSRSGADINDLNTVRKQLSLLKGGRLAELAYPATVVSLILSDVVGDPLDTIASGPTVQNETTASDAIQVLKKYEIYGQIPESIKTILENAKKNNTDGNHQDKPGAFNHVTNIIIGSNRNATLAARNIAHEMGYQCVVLSHAVEGDVETVATIYADLSKHIDSVVNGGSDKRDFIDHLKALPWKIEENAMEEILNFDFSRKMILIFAGEPTVVVKGTGKGGRNQQLALAFSLKLNNLEIESCNVSFLSAGTDGIDGPTDAAGALGSLRIIAECQKQHFDARAYLENNDSYGLYTKLLNGEFLVKIGHTGTNVMDVHFLKVDGSF